MGEGCKNATPPFLINKCRYEADMRLLLGLMLFKTDKYLRPHSSLFDVTSEYTPFTRIITIRKWTCANYFKRTTKIDRFRTDIFGPCNLTLTVRPSVSRKSTNFHNVCGSINTITEARQSMGLCAVTFTITDFARRLRHPQNHRARSLCAVIDDRLIRASTHKFSVTSRPQPTSVAECDAMDS